MGAHEDELVRIRAAGPFAAPELGALRSSLAALARTMKDVAGSPGWAGLSAEAASAHLEDLSRRYLEIEATIGELQAEVDRANAIRAAALADFDALPSAKAPAWVHGTLDAFDFPGIPQPVDLAQGGLAIIEGFLGGQREQAAGRILAAYEAALRQPAARTAHLRADLRDVGSTAARLEWPEDDGDPGGTTETGSWTSGGVYRGDGYQGVEYVFDVPRPPGSHSDVEIGVDDRGPGLTPGGAGGPESPGDGNGLTDPRGPGGVPATGIGAGVGSAAAGAGALAVARIAGGAGAGAAAGTRLGSGGLLGAGPTGSPPASGAAESAAARAGAAAPHRSAGQGLLGAGATSGTAREKDRERGRRGLGGPIAPTIDDEGDVVLPGAGARAGSRAAAPASAETPDLDATDLPADG